MINEDGLAQILMKEAKQKEIIKNLKQRKAQHRKELEIRRQELIRRERLQKIDEVKNFLNRLYLKAKKAFEKNQINFNFFKALDS